MSVTFGTGSPSFWYTTRTRYWTAPACSSADTTLSAARTVGGGGRGESDRDGEQEERCGQEGEAAHVVTVIGGTAR